MKKAVKVRCFPVKDEQMRLLNETFEQVREFLDMSAIDLLNHLYHRAKEQGTRLPMRTVSLLARRFAQTVTKNEIIPLDSNTYNLVRNEHGYFEIDVKLLGNNDQGQQPRVRLPISLNDSRYYDEIIEMVDEKTEGAIIHRRGNDIMLTVTTDIEMKCEERLPAVFIGIDLNMKKDAVSIYDPESDSFKENFFYSRKGLSITCDRLQRRLSRISKGKRKRDWTDEMREKVQNIYDSRVGAVKNDHGVFVSRLLDIAERYVDKNNVIFVIEDLEGITQRVSGSRKFNSWLHSQWCFGRFKTILESKGYPVRSVYPMHTSSKCHRCGETGVKDDRRFSCPHCGLTDFNRDLNAARNIAVRGFNYVSKIE